MPMSPRLKMRRGRFGAGGFKAPIVLITDPVGGNVTVVGSPQVLSFTGSAFDDLQGDISSTIDWHLITGSPSAGVGSPALAVGSTVDLGPFLVAGSPAVANVVVARARDAGGKQGSVTETFLVEI